MNSILVAVCICGLLGVAVIANIYEGCTANSDCPTNMYCQKHFSNCDKGECTCNDGYTANANYDQKFPTCLMNVAKDGECTATSYCLGGTICDIRTTNTCICPLLHTYNSLTSTCVHDNGAKLITEQCTHASDCIGHSTTSSNNKVECVADSGTTTPLYCRCLSGYKVSNYECRKPYLEEECTLEVGCGSQRRFGESSQVTETCQSGVCACPAGSFKSSIEFMGVTYKFCYKTYSGTEKSDGASCKASNECASKICEECPGTSSKTCLTVTFSGAAVKGASLVLMVVALLALTF